ncbi:NUFIP1 domain-containing protein [Heracleum sosnowskyi]|uniref:NUFIP1 domain-containing protein n=1 Tax=Heracleum sosnowskyi TaxID=360622 RepID=A0AAD8HVF2_9APIA|nr:NUFIP1 domain-containing protein [Heracleum sosnowskyi]
MQNIGQFVQMPMGVNVPFLQNQVRGLQNPSFNGNQQFGVMGFNGISMQGNQQQNAANGSQQLQGNSSVQALFGSVQSQQTQNFQPQGFNNQQGNPNNDSLNNNMANTGRNSQSRNFERHPRQDRSQGFAKSQNHHMQNGKGKFKNPNGRGSKGYQNESSRKFGLPDPSDGTQVEKKKFPPPNYTEQEIHQWREARKRHYPSESNIEKKSKKKMAESELADTEAKLRRQQLKEVLVKQAELGCEVAEIPAHYLSDSEKQVHGAEQNHPAFNKRGRSRNRSNKRGRHENDRFGKKQRPSNKDPANMNDQSASKQMQRTRNNDTITVQKREPTLLQKLLSADIRRDRSRLLQVFRFMVMNSFFKDQPEKPLMFPTVIVKETGEDGPMEQKQLHIDEDE